METLVKNDKYIVYIHHNLTNHKVYIGITCQNPEKRWQKGLHYKSNAHFYSAICKYGWDGFEHIIYAKNIPAESAFEIEKELIKLYNSNDHRHGYNISSGGESGGFIDGFYRIRKYCKDSLNIISDLLSEEEKFYLEILIKNDPKCAENLMKNYYKIKLCKYCNKIFHYKSNTSLYCSECNTAEKKKERADISKRKNKLTLFEKRQKRVEECKALGLWLNCTNDLTKL